jgi:hypothetical protein
MKREIDEFVAGDPDLPINPVIEAYKKDVDQTLLVENLRRSVDQRMHNLQSMYNFWKAAQEARR